MLHSYIKGPRTVCDYIMPDAIDANCFSILTLNGSHTIADCTLGDLSFGLLQHACIHDINRMRLVSDWPS